MSLRSLKKNWMFLLASLSFFLGKHFREVSSAILPARFFRDSVCEIVARERILQGQRLRWKGKRDYPRDGENLTEFELLSLWDFLSYNASFSSRECSGKCVSFTVEFHRFAFPFCLHKNCSKLSLVTILFKCLRTTKPNNFEMVAKTKISRRFVPSVGLYLRPRGHAFRSQEISFRRFQTH